MFLPKYGVFDWISWFKEMVKIFIIHRIFIIFNIVLGYDLYMSHVNRNWPILIYRWEIKEGVSHSCICKMLVFIICSSLGQYNIIGALRPVFRHLSTLPVVCKKRLETEVLCITWPVPDTSGMVMSPWCLQGWVSWIRGRDLPAYRQPPSEGNNLEMKARP